MRARLTLPLLIAVGMTALAFAAVGRTATPAVQTPPPNIVLIYADDLGYGDVSSYGATRVRTPNIDALAAAGLRFTRAHSPSATCTPSRYAMLTGEYAWRRAGTGIARGDAPLIIEPGRTTLASILKEAGYATGVIGKWHLGLGPQPAPDWNADIRPGPLELGFDDAFLVPATGDRVPTVYVEGRRVVGLDPADPIRVSFGEPVGDEPTGREHPELLKVHPSHTHDQTIVNGVSRIGYMSGGKAARWIDEDMADSITTRAVGFIEEHRTRPFFLYFSTQDIHVPRMPHARFIGKSGMGPRGDAILQLDWSVGEIVRALDRLDLTNRTLVIFTSDNGPVLDDGYRDQAVELAGGHNPNGPFRGGKYSAFEAGTRVPFVVRWPERVRPGTSAALLSQVDFPATLAALSGVALTGDAAPDSHNLLPALLGESENGRDHLVEHSAGTLALVRGRWKLIAPSKGARINQNTGIELGNDPEPQLYDLEADPGERRNLAADRPELVRELTDELARIRAAGRSR
jgi:arylsulfatase A-like enzyme